ncbi:hypothetical protein NHX12_001386 [Muraenolepis orangiensis]|uniref:Ig-like domain-containing protein n=1 Tax=Muraenolepis orangiensis TaxID=630683 RepID=A0A9Q0DZL1_9TELE|nr:hypothetical protein NHX12_001386 [Muraenolepis orangiensis]
MDPLGFRALNKMVLVTIVLFSLVWVAEGHRLPVLSMVSLEDDRPFVRQQVSYTVTLDCCYRSTGICSRIDHTWMVTTVAANGTHIVQEVNALEDRLTLETLSPGEGRCCSRLILRGLRFSDSGLYRCRLTSSAEGRTLTHGTLTHGTFLQVWKPLDKILNMSENAKNHILTIEGILLLLCVLLPGAKLLRKSKEIHALEKKKATREEENIYEGLRIEDFSSPYDQIQRSREEVTYQDVHLEEGESHLEKP